MKSECHFLTNISVISPCQMFTAGLKSLVSETFSICDVVWASRTLFFADKQFDSSADILVFYLSTQSIDVERSIILLARIRKCYPDLMIIVTMEDCIAYLVYKLKLLSVNTIISQKADLSEWGGLINLALKGQGGCCQRVSQAIEMAPEVSSLKCNELIMLSHIANGMPLKNVADLMSREIKTVIARRLNAMRKLGIHNYAELIALKGIIANESARLAAKQ